MNALHLQLTQWLAAGAQPTPWLLALASGLAMGGGWLAAAVMGWAAWRQPGQRTHICFMLAGAGLTALLCHAIAARLYLPRPFILGLVPAYIPHGASGAMPSTHASAMFMVAFAFLARPALRGPGAALFVLAAATGWARIHVGVHFPLDIAVGLMFGAFMAGVLGGAWRLVELAMPRRLRRLGRRQRPLPLGPGG